METILFLLWLVPTLLYFEFNYSIYSVRFEEFSKDLKLNAAIIKKFKSKGLTLNKKNKRRIFLKEEPIFLVIFWGVVPVANLVLYIFDIYMSVREEFKYSNKGESQMDYLIRTKKGFTPFMFELFKKK